MYYSGQIIYDIKKKKPTIIRNVWNPKEYPEEHTNFVLTDPIVVPTGVFMSGDVALPKNIRIAMQLLKEKLIRPAKFQGHICSVRGRVWWKKKHCEDCNPNATAEGLIDRKDYQDA